ncbi:hypothetical protein G6F22_014860 [Rhizopus arrhizus]|nr:hypothetical protein G6F22_014860 [Rhizopus arrhizus]
MSENVTQFNDLFSPINKKHRIFQRRTDIGAQPRPTITLPSMHKPDLPHSALRRAQTGASALRQSVDSQVLAQHAPPHVLVNRDGDIVYYSGRTGKYLEAAAGVPTRQVLTLARKGLRLDLRTLLHEAAETGRPAVHGDPDSGAPGRPQGKRAAVPDPVCRPRPPAEPRRRPHAQQHHAARRRPADRAGTARHARAPAIHDRGIRDRAGGTEVFQ